MTCTFYHVNNTHLFYTDYGNSRVKQSKTKHMKSFIAKQVKRHFDILNVKALSYNTKQCLSNVT